MKASDNLSYGGGLSGALSIFRRSYPRVLLEIAREERLVGEVQLESDFLHTIVGGPEPHLYLLNAAVVDDFLGRVAGQLLDDGRKIARGDAKLVGIELHIAMGAAMLEDKGYEFLQQLLLPRRVLGVAMKELGLRLVVDVHQEVLQAILQHREAERMLLLGI